MSHDHSAILDACSYLRLTYTINNLFNHHIAHDEDIYKLYIHENLHSELLEIKFDKYKISKPSKHIIKKIRNKNFLNEYSKFKSLLEYDNIRVNLNVSLKDREYLALVLSIRKLNFGKTILITDDTNLTILAKMFEQYFFDSIDAAILLLNSSHITQKEFNEIKSKLELNNDWLNSFNHKYSKHCK